MNDRSVKRNVLVWGLPFAIVLVALGYETDWGRGIAHDEALPKASAPMPVPVALLPEYAINGGVEARRETVERSLFNPTRRPAPPATQTAAAKATAEHGQYALTGTTMVGNEATAFLREIKSGKSHTVRQGETLNGVTIAEVATDHVTLKQGGDVEELSLKIASGPKSTIQVAAPPVPGGVPHPGQPAPPPVPAGAGGSAGNAGAGARPVAPPPPNATNPAAAAAHPNGSISVSELLAQRRRAARAAAEAAATGQAPARP
jgi:hypothetical protein